MSTGIRGVSSTRTTPLRERSAHPPKGIRTITQNVSVQVQLARLPARPREAEREAEAGDEVEAKAEAESKAEGEAEAEGEVEGEAEGDGLLVDWLVEAST